MKFVSAILSFVILSSTVFASDDVQEATGRCTIEISSEGAFTSRQIEFTTHNSCYELATTMVKDANNRKLPVGVAVKMFKTSLIVNFEVID